MSAQSLSTLAYLQSISRRRNKCWAETEYTHDNLISYIQTAVPSGWEIVGPEKHHAEPPAHFPRENDAEAQKALMDSLSSASREGDSQDDDPIDDAYVEDLLNGHCETCAVAITKHVLEALQAESSTADGSPGNTADPLASAFSNLAVKLQGGSVPRQVEVLFEAEKRAREYDLRSGKSTVCSSSSGGPQTVNPSTAPVAVASRIHAMWQPLLGEAGEFWPAPGSGSRESPTQQLCAGCDDEGQTSSDAASAADTAECNGARGGVLRIIRNVAIHFEETLELKLKDSHADVSVTGALPLYVMNYIWDGDEVTREQMQECAHETAQFSLHVVGLVFHCHSSRTSSGGGKPRRAVYVCDPNGPIVPGASMEFLRLPVTDQQAQALPAAEPALPPSRIEPTTAVSRFDRDQRAPLPVPLPVSASGRGASKGRGKGTGNASSAKKRKLK